MICKYCLQEMTEIEKEVHDSTKASGWLCFHCTQHKDEYERQYEAQRKICEATGDYRSLIPFNMKDE